MSQYLLLLHETPADYALLSPAAMQAEAIACACPHHGGGRWI